MKKFKLSSQKLPMVLGVAVTLLVSSFGVYLLTRSEAAPDPNNTVSFTVSPTSVSVFAGSTQTFDILIDSGTEQVSSLQAQLSYPMDKLEFMSIDTSMSPYEFQAAQSGGNGIVDIARGTLTPTTGQKTLAKVTFKALADGSAPITFTNETVVLSPANDNILDVKTGATVSIATARPDLVIDSISWSPAVPKEGEEVRFSAVIRNQGDAATAAGVVHRVKFTVSNNTTLSTWSNDNTTSLGVSASRTQAANGGTNGKSTWTATRGTFTITATVDDTALIAEKTETNNTLTASIAINDTTPPTVTLTAPAGGSTLKDTITLSATAADNVGVTRVEFYRGTTLIGQDTTSPYSVSFDTKTVADGAYVLTARAFDAQGNNATSSAVNVTVQNAKPGDVTGDGFVTISDLNLVIGHWGRTDRPITDFDRSGRVDIWDFNFVISRWGS